MRQIIDENDQENEDASGFRLKTVGPKIIHIIQSQMTEKTFIHIGYFNFFWIFVVGSVLGLGIETLFHIAAFGFYESRAGLVWGPCSPLYGTGAVLLSLALDRFCKAHNLFIFIMSAAIGSSIEFCASLIMQYSWAAIAWDYTGTLGSLEGRTNLLFAVMWGFLGLFWVHAILPLVKHVLDHFDGHALPERIVTGVMTVFLVLDVTATSMALSREQARVDGIPPTQPFDAILDQAFPDEYMQERFHNLWIAPNVEDAQPREDAYTAQKQARGEKTS
jgi:uncharacterized membrane protein